MWFSGLVLIFLLLTSSPIFSTPNAVAASATNNTYGQTLTGQVSQNQGRLSASTGVAALNASSNNAGAGKAVLAGQISQNQGRIYAANALPAAAPSFHKTLSGSVSAAYADPSVSRYAGSINSDVPAANGNYSGAVNIQQFSAPAAAQAAQPQTSPQRLNANANNNNYHSGVKRAELQAVGIGLSAAGLGALHCPICRMLKGF